MLETPGNDAGTCHAIALKPRENYCNLERLHNRNQPFLMVYRNFISLHLNYVVQWLCKSMLNCSPMIDYQLDRWYILLSDAFSLTTIVSAFYVFNRYKRFISRFLAFSGKYNPLIQSALQIGLYRGLPTHFSTGWGGSLL